MKYALLSLLMVIVAGSVLAPARADLVSSQNQFANFLGTFGVAEVTEDDSVYKGSVCQDYVDSSGEKREADFRCGQKVWVFRNPPKDQIAMFLAPDENVASEGDPTLFTFSVFRAALFSQNRKCQTSFREQDLSSLFSSQVCRGFLTSVKAGKTASSDFYLYFPNMEPKAGQVSDASNEAVAREIVTGMVTGLPIGLASAYLIEVPRGSAPTKIQIREITTAAAFGVTTTFQNILTLRVIP